ncbi:MAG: WecB/TagA/CpsF family glycosyltransferase [Patescibacteria group bacterium]
MKDSPVKKKILGISLSDLSTSQVLEYVMSSVEKSRKKLSIVTPNPEIVVYAHAHPQYQKLINEADIAICDGAGLYLAAKYLGVPLHERITGVDLMQKLCGEAAKKAVTVGFLGGRGNVAERTAQCLREKYPGLKVVFVAPEWSEEGFAVAEQLRRTTQNPTRKNAERKDQRLPVGRQAVQRVVPQSSAPVIDILFVAFGFPKQEEWIAHNLPILPVKVAMGVGGAFDYLSGEVIRAPFFIRAIGLEWLFRLIRQPWRWRRQLALLTFVRQVVSARLRT